MKSLKPKIIYIAGYGRSGSTIFDLILSSNSQVVGLGEIANLFKDEFKESLSPFWKTVIEEVLTIMDLSFQEAHYLTRQADKGNMDNVSFADYERLWLSIFSVLHKSIGNNIWFVDSSKTSNESYNRAKLLRKMGCEVKIIHLIRNPFEAIASVRKGSNRMLEKGEYTTPPIFVGVKTFLSWVQTNARVKWIYNKKAGYDKIVVSYSDLRNDLELVLKEVSNFVGIEYDVAQVKSMNLRPSIDYGVSGNRLRRKEEIKLSFAPDHLKPFKKSLGNFLVRVLS